jgi:hypothetical protein
MQLRSTAEVEAAKTKREHRFSLQTKFLCSTNITIDLYTSENEQSIMIRLFAALFPLSCSSSIDRGLLFVSRNPESESKLPNSLVAPQRGRKHIERDRMRQPQREAAPKARQQPNECNGQDRKKGANRWTRSSKQRETNVCSPASRATEYPNPYPLKLERERHCAARPHCSRPLVFGGPERIGSLHPFPLLIRTPGQSSQ